MEEPLAPSSGGDGWVIMDAEWSFNPLSSLTYHKPSGQYFQFDAVTGISTLQRVPPPSSLPECKVEAAARFMQGRRPKQEDRHVLLPSFSSQLPLPLPHSFFALYDGHLGTFASEFCSTTLHEVLQRHLQTQMAAKDESSQGDTQIEPTAKRRRLGDDENEDLTKIDEEEKVKEKNETFSESGEQKTMKGENQAGDEGTESDSRDKTNEDIDGDGTRKDYRTFSEKYDQIILDCIKTAFEETDAAFLSKFRLRRDGCTAVVLLLLGSHLFIGSVGDSRAIVGRRKEQSTAADDASGSPTKWIVERLTEDHKPNRPDEKERIEKAGGQVVTFGGVARVAAADYQEKCKRIKQQHCRGGGGGERPPTALAVSRAFGDRELKVEVSTPLVIATPECRKVSLDPSCEVVVAACDGIWDVLKDDEVIQLASHHLHNAEEAASAIVKEAFKRGSDDNLTVLVVTFKEFQNK